jgi:hypothetical protein
MPICMSVSFVSGYARPQPHGSRPPNEGLDREM